MEYLNKNNILKHLHEIDDELNEPQNIFICGSASLILQDIDFRTTIDIDFAIMPDQSIIKIINQQYKESNYVFDFKSAGVIQLFEDFQNRLIKIENGFNFLNVYVLSRIDWAVSKLNTPKFDDLITFKVVSLEELKQIKMDMWKYCGLSEEKAMFDLDYAIDELENN